MDNLSCYLHYPMIGDRQMRGQSFLFDVVLSHRVTLAGGTFLEGAKPPGLDI
jgi:hypothetical protein